jgi:hypothetical protein
MSIYEILSALDLTQSVHAKISIGMHRGVKFKISRILLIGLETRLGWRTDRKFLGRRSARHKENSGFAAPTPGRHISTFRCYQILFSIRNPYINRFTNHFSIHSWPSYPQKVVLHSIAARFSLRPSHFAISLSLSYICHVTSRKLQLPQCIVGDDLHIWSWFPGWTSLKHVCK